MKEKDLLENLAKALGAEDKFKELEEKRLREKRMLESLGAQLGVRVEEEEERDVPVTFIKQPAPVVMLEVPAAVFEEEVVEQPQEVQEQQPVEEITENVIPVMPDLPVDTIVTKSVEKIAKATPKDVQKTVDEIPGAMRRELDAVKKSITDLHRFAQRHSQMGGGGEVRLLRLDDVNAATVADGLYLRYDELTRMLVFDSPSGGGGVAQVQSDWNQSNNLAVNFILNKPDIPSVLNDLGDVSISAPSLGQVLKYNGSYWYNGTDETGSGGGLTTPGYYGSFYDTTTQTAAVANTAYAMKFNTTAEARDVSVDSGHANTRVYVTYSGVYNIQFSAQIHNTGGGGNGKNVNIWLAKNGTNVAETNTDVSADTNTPYKVAAWNFVLTLNAGDYFELMWATDNTGIVLEAGATIIDGGPNIPSVILTVQQVAAILIPTDITGTANNANYLDGYHANTFQTVTGLSANVAALTSNNSLHLGGIAANQYAYANISSLSKGSDTLSLNGANKVDLPGGTSYIFSATDNITIAPDNTGSNYLEIINNVGATLSTDRAFEIRTNVDGTDKTWTFTQGGSLFFPDSTYQTTAWTGSVATLTSNNSLYLGGIAANQYAYANQIVTYTLPTANATALGGVKIDGTTITIANGVISSPNQDLTGYQTTAGLSANVATLTSNNTSFVGSVSAANVVSNTQLQSNLASYAALNTNVAFGSVSSNTATAFIAGIAANSGVALQMPHEGALRNMSTTSSTMYFDTSNGGSAHGHFNFRSSNNFTSILHLGVSQVTFNSGAAITGQTPYVGRTSFNVALDTVVTVDNLKYRISNQGGVFPQIASASGSTVDVCYDVLGIVNGATNPAYANNSGYILLADGTWLSIYSSHGMDTRSDRLTAHITDKNAGKIYRVTFMKTNNSSNTDGYNIIVERII